MSAAILADGVDEAEGGYLSDFDEEEAGGDRNFQVIPFDPAGLGEDGAVNSWRDYGTGAEKAVTLGGLRGLKRLKSLV